MAMALHTLRERERSPEAHFHPVAELVSGPVGATGTAIVTGVSGGTNMEVLGLRVWAERTYNRGPFGPPTRRRWGFRLCISPDMAASASTRRQVVWRWRLPTQKPMSIIRTLWPRFFKLTLSRQRRNSIMLWICWIGSIVIEYVWATAAGREKAKRCGVAASSRVQKLMEAV